MNMGNINTTLENIINEKYSEVDARAEHGRYDKISKLKHNYIGQIGEQFIKKTLNNLGIKMKDLGGEIIHDEFDICLDDSDETKIEIKTASKDVNSKFQFNGFNPKYSSKYILCLGIDAKNAYFKVLPNKIYENDSGYFCLNIDGKEKKLTEMNPKGTVNYKLTLPPESLEPLENLEDRLKELFIDK